VRNQGIGLWWIATPKDNWPDESDFKEMMKKKWDEDYGDRRQEIVFIGLKNEINESEIQKNLDDCLIKDYLSNPLMYQNIADPFPKWFETENE